jgi:N,N'-diacetyllegionaminate synthase
MFVAVLLLTEILARKEEMPKVFIIAEAGVNHNGSLKIAKKMVDVAVSAGADAIKFQTFHARLLASKFAPKAAYQRKTMGKDENQLEMIKRLELGLSAHKELIRYCRAKKIAFLSTPFDLESIGLLQRLGLRMIKVSSGEVTNLPYLRKIGSLRKKIIISTGMANLKEIRKALDILISSGTKKNDITVLHCNTAYPTPMEDVDLKAMIAIRDKFKVKVGYSDHTLGIEVPIAAVALGASIIEKHFTLDKNMNGPDHKSSLERNELKAMVSAVRNIEQALGRGIKRPSKSERKNMHIARKSIIAKQNIRRGEVLTEDNITIKRPGTGISPMNWDEVIGRIAKRSFSQDELIQL